MRTDRGLLEILFVSAMVFFFLPGKARGNVYATDIRLNGSLGTITNNTLAPVTITYRLNQAATSGVTVSLTSGGTVVAALPGPAAVGLNTVIWGGTNSAGGLVAAGAYGVSITAGAAGFPLWTQISIDTNAGMAAFYPLGLDVDKNTNSPYYGRVIMGCAVHSGVSTVVPAAAQQTGLYKMNADGSQADEGWYGNANYLTDDAHDTPVAGQMPDSGGDNPCLIRIGPDDRVYWCDDTVTGAIIACDLLASTNQIIINKSGYAGNPDLSLLDIGFQQFDVTGNCTVPAALWLCDLDSPNWGIWMFHLSGGVADPRDIVGTQAVSAGGVSDLNLGSTGGCMVDTNLDIFVGQDVLANSSSSRALRYPSWNGGVLPPEAGSTAYAYGAAPNQVAWASGAYDGAFCGVRDVVLNSRTNPTLVALPMNTTNFPAGLRVLNAATGQAASFTNGATVQTLTNLDGSTTYTCAAWDNVGNLYGASTSRYLWRVFSPPGTNQATTVSVAQIIFPAVLVITKVTAVPTTTGCAVVTIAFNALANSVAAGFSVRSASTANGAYSIVSGTTVTGSNGTYQAVFNNCSTEFYKISQP